ncbi:class I adenylate-forming enzyme family protein [Phytohabitans suffuscus]|uniref:Long-chain-fatty-acid--CoA ligase n=1 Tax=Phytohabitans suffuscus TaxID=624315 RepID=A0A6F8Z1C5_9ACTN|nr:class I adenylate-forming enzyme family protein [Phytohabitans suffuscus]BCB92069.1 long-chain-fatty-acid--CoA ligase [Phytohabitans suffuscus]
MNVTAALLERSRDRWSRPALTTEGGARLTYGELFDAVSRAAGRLAAAGVRRDSKVVVFAENCAAYAVVYLACARLGAALATAHPGFRRGELAGIVADCDPAVIVVDRPLRPIVEEVVARRATRATLVEIDSRDEAVDGWGAEAVTGDLDLPGTHPVLIAYTSGSTDRPKAVVHGHAGQIFVASAHEWVWHLGPDDRLLLSLSMSWLYGLVTSCLATLFAGGEVLMLRHFNPVRALALVEERGATVMTGVTTMYVKLVEVAGRRPVASRLRMCVAGGEPRNDAAFARFADRFGVPVLDCYASSECLPVVAHDTAQLAGIHGGAIGRVVPGVQARIVDPDGRDVPAGEVGELIVRSPGQMLGYLDNPELTASVLRDGWYHTRDLCAMDGDGCLSILGRATDMIIRGGANVSPVEVERVLAEHRLVEECAVVGIPDDTYGQTPHAFVVLAAGADADGGVLREYCRTHLAEYKVPSGFTFVAELPHGPNGKVARTRLRTHAPVTGGERP